MILPWFIFLAANHEVWWQTNLRKLDRFSKEEYSWVCNNFKNQITWWNLLLRSPWQAGWISFNTLAFSWSRVASSFTVPLLFWMFFLYKKLVWRSWFFKKLKLFCQRMDHDKMFTSLHLRHHKCIIDSKKIDSSDWICAS